MLELLAGPYTLKDGITGVNVNVPFGGDCVWVDGHGLYSQGVSYGSVSNSGVVKLDGTFFTNNWGFNTFHWFVYDAALNRPLLATYETALYPYDALTGTYDVTPFVTWTSGMTWVGQMVIYKDRWLRMSNKTVMASTDHGVTWTVETTLTTTGTGNTHTTLTPFQDGLLCVAFYSGVFVFYDMNAKVQISGDYVADQSIASYRAGFYDRKHDVFVTYYQISGGYATRIWAKQVRPYALSAPVAVSSLLKGRVTQIKTRLTGSYGEPCVGELVNWSVTGGGSLLSTQSTTDDDGYAYVDYVAPVDSLPSPQITATVRY